MFAREASSFLYAGNGSSNFDITVEQQREAFLRENRFLPTGGGGVLSARGGGSALANRTLSEGLESNGKRLPGGHPDAFGTEVAQLPFGGILGAFSDAGNNGTSSTTSSRRLPLATAPLLDSSLLKWIGSSGSLPHPSTITKVIRLPSGRSCVVVAGGRFVTVMDEMALRASTNHTPVSNRSGYSVTLNLLDGCAGAITSLDCKALTASTKGEIVCVVGSSAATVVPFVVIPNSGLQANAHSHAYSPFSVFVQPKLDIAEHSSGTVSSSDATVSTVVGLDPSTGLPSFIAAATRYAVILYACGLPHPTTSPAAVPSQASLVVEYAGFQLFKGRRVVKIVDVGASGSSFLVPSEFVPSNHSMHRTDLINYSQSFSPSASVVLAALLDDSELHFVAKELPDWFSGCGDQIGVAAAIAAASPASRFQIEGSRGASSQQGKRGVSTSGTPVSGIAKDGTIGHTLRCISLSPSGAKASAASTAAERDESELVVVHAPQYGAFATLTGGIPVPARNPPSSHHAFQTAAIPEFYAVSEFISLSSVVEKNQTANRTRHHHTGSTQSPDHSSVDPRALVEKPSLAPLLQFNDFECFYNYCTNAIDVVAVGQCNAVTVKNATHAGPFLTNAVSGFLCSLRGVLHAVSAADSGSLIVVPHPQDAFRPSDISVGIVSVVGAQSSTERGLSSVKIVSSALPSGISKQLGSKGITASSLVPFMASVISCNNELFVSSVSCPTNTSSDDLHAATVSLKKGLKLVHSFGGPIQSLEVVGVQLMNNESSSSSATGSSARGGGCFCDILVGQGNTSQLYRLPLA